MDYYKDKFNNQADRIHKIDLGNGKYGYVGKQNDGTLVAIDNALAESILNPKPPVPSSDLNTAEGKPGTDNNGTTSSIKDKLSSFINKGIDPNYGFALPRAAWLDA
jgi:hypothetical protein